MFWEQNGQDVTIMHKADYVQIVIWLFSEILPVCSILIKICETKIAGLVTSFSLLLYDILVMGYDASYRSRE